jgi:hypothetical protein
MPLKEMLSKLNYTQSWIDCGILTDSTLTTQINEFELGEDGNTEHYRYRTITNFFDLQTSFDNKFLKDILHLLENDIDKSMAISATIHLLKKDALTENQFETVILFLKKFGDNTTKYIDKARKESIERHS